MIGASWIWILTAPALGAVDLPGVDVLSAGYDAASWNHADATKYRLFDLSAAGKQVHIAAINRTFTTPSLVTVTTDGPQSKRVEDSCEGAFTSFSDYLHTHQSSTSFDIGIKANNFSLGLHYHKEEADVYEAIDAKGQAVGLSESWWGMYQMTLPPPFLLAPHMDSIFLQAKTALKGIQLPKTEADQEIYNQVCCGPASFGTHYIGSAIVGARAVATSFVNSSYHKEYSEKTLEEQISIGFMWKKLQASLNHDASSFEKTLAEDFKNSSHWRMTYQPDTPDIHKSPSPWLAWEASAQKMPAVVNISASSIANLFYDDPVVMEHMTKTINFYVQQAQPPKLSDLPQATPEVSAEPTKVPGLQVVGCGFDAPSLESKLCLFETSAPGSTWSNPYYPNISYDVPGGFFAVDTPESTILNGSVVMETFNDYVEHSFWTESHHHSGFFGFGSKTEHKTTEEYYRQFYAHRYSLALSMRQVAWYTLSLMEFPLPGFNQVFKEVLDALPTHYDPDNATASAIFQQFFDAFGTDVVTKADMGGLVWAEDWFESCLSRKYSDKCITDEVTRGWWVFRNHHDQHTCDKRIVEDFSKYASRHYEMLGGTEKVDIAHWQEWALSVKNDPRPVKMNVAPIHYILPDSSRVKQALMNATDAYLMKSEVARNQTIDAMEKIRPSSAPVCNESVAAIAAGDSPDPRAALCPIVGYHGHYCPGSSFSISSNSDTEQLPRGVGLTIDISNGDLKLPAWDFTFSSSGATWTDPATNETFELPHGLSINTSVQRENVPSIRVFKTEDELVSVWEGAYNAGSWIGGEFGNSKGVSDLYTKIFSHQQSSSINQHPQALYRLMLKAGWESHLNSYARMALQALPEAYDANTYSRFMDTWGTHVANDTLIGGMMEQQVTMKDCMWQDPYLSGGLTDAQLQQYLTMDLAKAPPQDPFYSSRRKMTLDHRVGGNPELTDQKTWLASLAKDPALLKIYSYTDWPEVAKRSGTTSAAVIANLGKAIKDRLASRAQERATDKAAVAKQREAELLGPRPVVAVVAHGRRGGIAPEEEVGKSLTMKGYTDCPPGLSEAQSSAKCNTGVNIHSWNRVELVKPLRYERDQQGHMRSIRCFDLDTKGQCIEHMGPWVRRGCSLQPYATGAERPFHTAVPDKTVIGMVCADCEVVSSGFPQDATLKCVCPGYTQEELKDGEQQQEGEKEEEEEKNVVEKDLGSQAEKEAAEPDEKCCSTHSAYGMPNFKQCDKRWKCYPYMGKTGLSSCNATACRDGGPANQTNNICGSGCGVTSSAMVLSYFGLALNPPDVAKWLLAEGFRNDLTNISGATCNGVSHTAICKAAEHWGKSCEVSTSFDDLDRWLQASTTPVIAHVRHRSLQNCKFTHAGHYIVITGRAADNSTYTVSDPNSCDEANTHGTLWELSVECSLVGFLRMFDDNYNLYI